MQPLVCRTPREAFYDLLSRTQKSRRRISTYPLKNATAGCCYPGGLVLAAVEPASPDLETECFQNPHRALHSLYADAHDGGDGGVEEAAFAAALDAIQDDPGDGRLRLGQVLPDPVRDDPAAGPLAHRLAELLARAVCVTLQDHIRYDLFGMALRYLPPYNKLPDVLDSLVEVRRCRVVT